ncbi:MAG: hypothetical protein ACRDSO_01245 [Pseudonocardiaceae bacterium]
MDHNSELPELDDDFYRLWRPPDRFLLALGRVVYLMGELDSILGTILITRLAGSDTSHISRLVDGESTDWKLQKLKSFIDLEDYQSVNDPGFIVAMEYFRIRIPTLSGYITQRNRIIHSKWWLASEEGFVESWHIKRNRDPIEIMQSVEQIEQFCGHLEREVPILWMMCDVITHHRFPNLLGDLEALLEKVRHEQASSDLGE